jgi:protein ImuB
MKRILCLRFPAWPLQRLVVGKRELRESSSRQAIVIHRRDARGGEIVHLCSAVAWRQGIRPGMPLAEAKALFANEQDVYLAVHDPPTDLKWLARLAVWCERYSPLVGWNTTAGGRKNLLNALPPAPEPEALYLDITGIGALFGSEEALARELLSNLAERRFSARIGIADTVGAAWAVAGTTRNQSVAVVPRDQQEQALAPLPTAALRLADETLDTLSQLGIVTIQQLLALPRQGLAARLGPGLLLRIDQALGHVAELIESHRPPPAFQCEWLLEYPTDRREVMEMILSQLVERLALQLAQQQQGAMQLACRLDGAGHPPVTLQVGLYRPTASPRHLLELLRMQFERLRLRGAIGRVGLSALQTAPLETYQTSLFDDASLRCERAIASLLDRLSSRLGAEAVLQPWLRAEPLPEQAVQLLPAVANRVQTPSKKRVAAVDAFRRPPSISHRPLALYSPPLELDTLAVVPDGPPIRFHYAGQLHQVTRHWGPERIETAWWRGRSARRDYYRVETTCGSRFWLFRRLQDGVWFLHGVFE